jgi:hypothetical protein
MTYLLRIFEFTFLIFRSLTKEFFNLTKVFMMTRDEIFVECKKREKKEEIRCMKKRKNEEKRRKKFDECKGVRRRERRIR